MMAKKPRTLRPSHLGALAHSKAEYEHRRGSARQRGYTVEWDRASAAFKCEHPLCLGCHAVGRVTIATVVDHAEPHRGDMVKFWDRGQWQSACKWHHDVVKQHLERLFASGSIGVDDLRLDSATAQRVTRLMMPTAT